MNKEVFCESDSSTGKTVLVTGASGGIGTALARYFARRGCAVAVHYHRGEAAARTVVEQILSMGGSAEAFCANLTREDEVQTLFDRAEERFGFLDRLVNNAAVSHRGLLTDMTLEDWNELFAVNVTGTFLCCRRALKPMIHKKRGSILNISSMWGQVGASCEAAYSASKAALIGLTKALAQEEGPSGIRVNCLAPGVIATKMNAGLTEEELQALREETPLMRLGTPEEVAQAAWLLMENEFMTGQILGINGGFVL